MTVLATNQPVRSAAAPLTAPAPIRTAFATLERYAPAVGARWAERLWFTLPRARSDVTRGRDPGEPRDVVVSGRRVFTEAWGSGPTVYLMHGWGGHRDQMAAFVDPLVAQGRRVVAFDAPSHGASGRGVLGPGRSTLPEFADALAGVVDAHGPAHAVVAHSMGASAAALTVATLDVGRLVMLAPMASPVSYALLFAERLGFGPRIHGRLMARVARRVGVDMEQLDVVRLGRRQDLPPTLVVHDRDDTFIPFTHGESIARAWPGSTLRLTSGLGHSRLLTDPRVVSDVVSVVVEEFS